MRSGETSGALSCGGGQANGGNPREAHERDQRAGAQSRLGG